jgi:uncharacterized protein YbaP (TraB family)
VLYEALQYRIISIPVRGKPDPHVQAEIGYSPAELDEMELWQIAMLLDRHKIRKPDMPTRPEDFEERAAKYAEVMRQRKAAAMENRKKPTAK